VLGLGWQKGCLLEFLILTKMNKKRKKYQRRLKVGSLLSIVVLGAFVGIIACAFVVIKNAHVERSDLRRALLSEIKLLEKKVQTVELRVETLRDRRALAGALKESGTKLIPIQNSFSLTPENNNPDTSRVLGISSDSGVTIINLDRPSG